MSTALQAQAWGLLSSTRRPISRRKTFDGQSTAGFTLEDVSARLRGEKGTQVTITVEREGEPGRDITLTAIGFVASAT